VAVCTNSRDFRVQEEREKVDAFGDVLEIHEIKGEDYNNIEEPVYPTSSQ